jgi:tetratricopeptide (TPR) repeat protein
MSEESTELLQRAIAAAKAGDKTLAKRLLIEVTDRDERNEEAWLWLSGVVDDLEEMKLCLENVLTINPTNERARKGLAWVQHELSEQALVSAGFEQPPPIEEQISAVDPMFASTIEEEEELAPPENRVACPACGAMNFDFSTECVKCNFPFAITCPACNDYVATDTGLCPHCGTELPLPTKLAGVQERETAIEDAYREGLTFLEEGQYQEAKAAFELALEQDPNHIEALYNLGESCAKLGLTEEAQRHWEDVKSLQPSHPYVEKALESLLSPKERRLLARERRKAKREEAKKRQEGTRPRGQTFLDDFERKMDETPPPEEETGAFEAFLYALMIGFVIGVAYTLNFGLEGDLSIEQVPTILKQSIVVAIIVVIAWIVLGIASRLFSLIFKASGSMNGYMVAASRLLIPFLLLLLPVLINLPQVLTWLPEQVQTLLERSQQVPWLLFGGLALAWGLFLFFRGVSRVGRIPLWKGAIAGLLALLVAGGVTFGLWTVGYEPALTYADTLWPAKGTTTPSDVTPTPGSGG